MHSTRVNPTENKRPARRARPPVRRPKGPVLQLLVVLGRPYEDGAVLQRRQQLALLLAAMLDLEVHRGSEADGDDRRAGALAHSLALGVVHVRVETNVLVALDVRRLALRGHVVRRDAAVGRPPPTFVDRPTLGWKHVQDLQVGVDDQLVQEELSVDGDGLGVPKGGVEVRAL